MVTQSDIMNPPATWAGSRPEWMFYASLMKLGYQPSEDFIYQSPMLGVFHNPPGLAVNVQGTYYHYELGAATSARDKFAREALAGQGITLIFVDEDDLEQDPTGITEAALQFNDRSRLGGR